MTDRTGAEDEWRQQVLPVAGVVQGVEHLLAGGVLTPGSPVRRGLGLRRCRISDSRWPRWSLSSA